MMSLDVDKLWRQYYSTRDLRVRGKLLLQCLPIVRRIVCKMAVELPVCVDHADLLSAGVIGLLDAIERYDPQQGVKFKTFAYPRIRGAIVDNLRLIDWAPRSVRAKARLIERVRDELERKLGRTASGFEIADKLNMDFREYDGVLSESSKATLLSLDGARIDGRTPAVSFYDLLENPDSECPGQNAEANDTRSFLNSQMASLREPLGVVLSLYYFHGLNLREIGEVLGFSEGRICQFRSQALQELRSVMVSEWVF